MGVHSLHVFFPTGAKSGMPNPETAEERRRRLLRFLSEFAGITRHFWSAVFFCITISLLVAAASLMRR